MLSAAPKPSEDEVLSLDVLAREVSVEVEAEPSQFGVLVRHFLDRFFTNELASADGDAKTRLVQAACAMAIPGLVVALYLYPLYHLPRGHVGNYWGPRQYWAQAGDHYFYVLYSMVAMGLVTIFEWDFSMGAQCSFCRTSRCGASSHPPAPNAFVLLWGRAERVLILPVVFGQVPSDPSNPRISVIRFARDSEFRLGGSQSFPRLFPLLPDPK